MLVQTEGLRSCGMAIMGFILPTDKTYSLFQHAGSGMMFGTSILEQGVHGTFGNGLSRFRAHLTGQRAANPICPI